MTNTISRASASSSGDSHFNESSEFTQNEVGFLKLFPSGFTSILQEPFT